MQDKIIDKKVLHEGRFSVSKVKLQLESGDVAVQEMIEAPGGSAVLPYDPQRKLALLISEARAPVLHEGEARLFEVIAGAYDGDDAEVCAKREALEEAGVRLSALEHMGCAWATPANSTERVDYFLAPYSAEDRIAPGGGLAEEHEYISVCEVPLSKLKAMRLEGGLRDVKLLVLTQALELRHPELFE